MKKKLTLKKYVKNMSLSCQYRQDFMQRILLKITKQSIKITSDTLKMIFFDTFDTFIFKHFEQFFLAIYQDTSFLQNYKNENTETKNRILKAENNLSQLEKILKN